MDERSFQREADGTWTTGAALAPGGERVKIIVRGAPGRAGRKDVSAALDSLSKWPQIQQALAPALFAFYCRMEAEASDYGPDIASADEVWRGVDLEELEFCGDGNGLVEYVHGVGGCSWEQEHGLEFVLRGNCELLYVGAYEGWVYGEPCSDHGWNFAIPQNQANALANRRISDGELDEVARGSRPDESQSLAYLTPKAPWWKFW